MRRSLQQQMTLAMAAVGLIAIPAIAFYSITAGFSKLPVEFHYDAIKINATQLKAHTGYEVLFFQPVYDYDFIGKDNIYLHPSFWTNSEGTEPHIFKEADGKLLERTEGRNLTNEIGLSSFALTNSQIEALLKLEGADKEGAYFKLNPEEFDGGVRMMHYKITFHKSEDDDSGAEVPTDLLFLNPSPPAKPGIR